MDDPSISYNHMFSSSFSSYNLKKKINKREKLRNQNKGKYLCTKIVLKNENPEEINERKNSDFVTKSKL